jgi:hypothetical protein
LEPRVASTLGLHIQRIITPKVLAKSHVTADSRTLSELDVIEETAVSRLKQPRAPTSERLQSNSIEF